jgi:hypothetical protein
MASPEPVVRAFGMAGKVLGLFLPEIYVNMEQPAPIQYAVTDPPASVIGGALAAGNYPPQDLLFFVAKHLTYYRGEHYIRLLEPTLAGLTTLLLSALRTGDPYFPMAPDVEKQVAPVVQILRKELAPLQLEQLGKVVKGFKESKASVDMKKWVSSVELTACRAGLVVCNDLEAALRVLGAEPPGLSDLAPREKIKELLLFACSEEYFHLREMLDVGIRMV